MGLLSDFLAWRKTVRRIDNALASAPPVTANDLQDKAIEYVVVGVEGESPNARANIMGRVAEIALDHGAIVSDMIGPTVVFHYGGLPFGAVPTKGARQSPIDEIRRELGSTTKIVHGSGVMPFGLVGSGRTQRFTFVHDDLLRAFAMLASARVGACLEVQATDGPMASTRQ